MKGHVLVPIADGTEEIEAVCIIDTLRRAGLEVCVAAPGKLQVTASRGVKITAEVLLEACVGRAYDLIAIPGGMPGAQNLAQSKVLINLLREQRMAGRWIAAICAAPAVVLQVHGLLQGVRATCYPAFQDRLDASLVSNDRLVVHGKTVTAQGPGVALEFALTLVEQLLGPQKRLDVAQAMIV